MLIYPKLLAASGHELGTMGRYHLNFWIGEKAYQHEVTVLDDERGHSLHDIDVLLGWDFMCKYHAEITMNGLKLGTQMVQYVKKRTGADATTTASTNGDSPWDKCIRRVTKHRHEGVTHPTIPWWEDPEGEVSKPDNTPPEEVPSASPTSPGNDPTATNHPNPHQPQQNEGKTVEIDAELEIATKVTIPPRQAVMVPCRVPEEVAARCQVGSCEGKKPSTGDDDDICPPRHASYILLLVQNESTVSRTLRKDTKVPIRFIQQQDPPPGLAEAEPATWEEQWEEMANTVVAQSDNLDEAGKERLKELMVEFKDVFRLKTDPPGRVDEYAVPIQLTTQNPVFLNQYHLSAADNRESDKQVELMLKAGVIRPSISPYNFPRLFTDKKIITNEGTEVPDRRFCIDLRALNEISERISFPMPTCDHTIHRLRGSQYYSCLDILSGFWHLPLTPESCKYVAFSTGKGHFEFTVLPFGWVNSPFWFQRFTQTCIANPNGDYCQAYIDDLVVFSKDVEDHFLHLRQVLNTIRSLNVRLKTSKCSFFAREMEYLGHIISADGIRMNPKKVKVIMNLPRPTTKKQVRSFLGKVNYYAKFLPTLSHIARPLGRLTGKRVVFQWGDEEELAFQTLKQMIAEDVMLAFPDEETPFTITTDASEYAIGAVLSQKDGKTGVERPVMFLSKALDKTQVNWHTPEKETYAIVYALEKFRPYIYGRPFSLVTDHRALLWCCGKKNVHGRLARWSYIISQYAQDIQYIQGKNNHVADALSRAPYQPEPEPDAETDDLGANPHLAEILKEKIYGAVGINMVTTRAAARQMIDMGFGTDSDSEDDAQWPLDPAQVSLTPLFLPELWGSESNHDPDAQRGQKQVETSIRKDELSRWVHNTKTDANGLPLWWVPPTYRRDVLRAVHRNPMSAHPSAEKMFQLLQERVWWRKMESDVEDFVRTCHLCQLYRMGQADRPHIQTRRNAQCPMQRISLDILSMEGVKAPGKDRYVLVILDEFTRYAEAYPISSQDDKTVSDVFFNQFITRFGVPEEIVTDLGGCFVSKMFTRLCQTMGIKKMTTAAYRPQGNGANERVHHTLYTILRMITRADGKDWRAKLPLALYVYRNMQHSGIGTTPHRALLGYMNRWVTFEYYRDEEEMDVETHVARLHGIHKEIHDRMQEVQEARNARLNRQKQAPREYQPGDLVKFRIHDSVRNKMSPFWEGPAEVLRRVGPVDYELRFPEGHDKKHPVVHVAYLKPYFEEEMRVTEEGEHTQDG
jgi:transposase InsO family protein